MRYSLSSPSLVIDRWCRIKHHRLFSSLSMWHNSILQISPGSILPGDVTTREEHKLAAFVGDKILGASLARWILQQQQLHKLERHDNNPRMIGNQFLYQNEGSASRLASIILSNKFMADRFTQILPDPTFHKWIEQEEYNVHTLGTIVEASVAAVYGIDAKAVDSLVEWLIEQSQNCTENDLFNAKGKLLELGGSLSVEREGGKDHYPIFVAKATLEYCSFEATAIGYRKRDAEEKAASQMIVYQECKGNVIDRLLELGGSVVVDQKGGNDQASIFQVTACLDDCVTEAKGVSKRAAEEQAAIQCLIHHWYGNVGNKVDLRERITLDTSLSDTWKPSSLSDNELILRNNESLRNWWERGSDKSRDAFRRALHAPQIFPDKVISVDAWTRRSVETEDCNERYASALAVVVFKTSSNSVRTWSCTRTAPSASKARAAVGLLANEEISNMLVNKEKATSTDGISSKTAKDAIL